MPEVLSISPADLLLDSENPRLAEPGQGQRDIQRAIANDQQRKLVVLAKDIVRWGVNPADLPIVMRVKGDRRRYVVLEGNRRIAALKSLENPESIVGAVPQGVLNAIRESSRDYLDNPIQSINCLVVKEREDANHWIELRHTGMNEGAGIVGWGSDESSRFRARTGNAEPHTQALNFLVEQGVITPEYRRKVPVTSIMRLLTSRDVRSRLGVDVVRGELLILGNEKKVAKALKYVVDDFTKGRKKVGDIYTKEQRTAYARKIPKSIAVSPTKDSGKPAAETKPRAKKKVAKRKPPRDHLIPSDCEINVSDDRTYEIMEELRDLSLTQHTNAVAVLFRVFVELSVDDYIGRNGLAVNRSDKLRVKVQQVVGDLKRHKKLTDPQARAVRSTLQRKSLLGPNVDTLNDYVHNPHVFPAPSDLRAYWSTLQPFIVSIWS